MIRVLIIDKTAGLASSHQRHQALAEQAEIELHVFGPRRWVENGRKVRWQPPGACRYTPHFGRVLFKDYYARHIYTRGLSRAVEHSRPHIIQLLEEPWALSAGQTLLAAKRSTPDAKLLFYTWENIYRPWVYPSRLSCLYRVVDKRMHRASDAAVCATAGAEAVLRQKGYQKPVRVIPYGIPQFFFEALPGHHPAHLERASNPMFTIGYAGRLLYMKGVDLLIDALPRLSGCRLLLIGSGDYQSELARQAQALGVASRIEWLGSLSEQEMVRALSRMDVLVLPSRRVEHWQEQLGRVLIEAMAVGVPVIGAASGAIPEVIGEAGLLFEENSGPQLLEQLQRLKNNPSERDRLAQMGRERARRYYTWPRFAQALSAFYQTLLNEYPHDPFC